MSDKPADQRSQTPPDALPEYIPVRMLNEFVYCPRLAYLEWADGEFIHNSYTLEGKMHHRRVERKSDSLKEADAVEPLELTTRSVTLSSQKLGIISKLDILETKGKQATPVDYKRGKRPHIEGSVWEPEKVQLCAQGLLLREHGYQCREGFIYFQGSRERVSVEFDDVLIEKTLQAIQGIRKAVAESNPPPPLVDSPKCPRCSLLPVCLPDEVGLLQGKREEPRPLYARRETGWPLYLTGFGGWVRKEKQVLVVELPDTPVQKVKLGEISQVVVIGPVNVSTSAVVELAKRGIPVTYLTAGGWFIAHTQGTGHHNVSARISQFRSALESETCLKIARGLVRAKILNCRTLLRRNAKGSVEEALRSLKRLACRSDNSPDIDHLRGIEGAAAAAYFGSFERLFNPAGNGRLSFEFKTRNRRPPLDPVNCMLSMGYSLLLRHWTVALSAVGLDPYLGFYHQPRFGRPSLALDLMEPYRPLLADSAAVMAANNGEVGVEDFIRARNGVSFTPAGRKKFISAFERAMDREFTHPVFGYRISYRRSLEVDARLFSRYLSGEFEQVPVWTTR